MSTWQYVGNGCCIGKQLSSSDGFSRTECQNLCDNYANCTGYSYYSGTNWCAHFDSCVAAEFRSGCTDAFESWKKPSGLFYFIHVVISLMNYIDQVNMLFFFVRYLFSTNDKFRHFDNYDSCFNHCKDNDTYENR